MVRKISALSLSLALAAASALACDLSTGGQTITTDIGKLTTDNQAFTSNINAWQVGGSELGIGFTSQAVSNDVAAIISDLSGYEPTACDIPSIIAALEGAAPGIVASLQALAGRYDDFVTASIDSNIGQTINDLASSTMSLIATIYELLPCGEVNQAFDALDSITAAFASAQQAFGQDVTPAPATPCGNSTPPSCTKRQVR
ncbi:hypothetical protein TRVA0_009S00496 [Trichomonascus vanleenenianus]|uniref:uncharacterized protein n=1 Tax=Trichomonascus vanleenenianus TaxID=2268995 RepID=UPI003ECA7FBA